MSDSLQDNMKSRSTWLRGLFMLLFVIFYSLAELVVGAVALFQFLSLLFTGGLNARLVGFGQSLSEYVYQVMRFLTFNTEDKPYPFSPWPQATAPVEPGGGEEGPEDASEEGPEEEEAVATAEPPPEDAATGAEEPAQTGEGEERKEG